MKLIVNADDCGFSKGINYGIYEAYKEGIVRLYDQFNEDRVSDETMNFISYEIDQARDFGLTGTPPVWVCGNKISWGDLDEIVDHYLEGSE